MNRYLYLNGIGATIWGKDVMDNDYKGKVKERHSDGYIEVAWDNGNISYVHEDDYEKV